MSQFPDRIFSDAMRGQTFAASSARAAAPRPQAVTASVFKQGTDYKRVEYLEKELSTAQARIAQLECELGLELQAPTLFELTVTEAIMFGVLMKRKLVFKTTFMAAIYSDRIDEEPQEKIIDVLICRMRAKLKRFDVHIETQWGQGYFMPPSSKKRVEELTVAMGGNA